MDPRFIGPEAWAEISVFVTNIWLFVVSIIIFASNMLIGHNAIPSLVTSRHLSSSWQKIRPPIYGIAVIAFVAALYFVFTALQGGRSAIKLIYPDFWI